MLPPQRTRPTFFPAKRAGSFISAARPTAPAPFDHRLLDLEQHQDRLLDVVFRDQDDVVDEGADDGQRQRPGRLDADAVGDGRLAALAIAVVDRVPRRREALGLDADDVQVGAERLRRRRHAGDQAAAADGDDQGVDLGLLGEHLERDRALAGDHRQVVERMDDGVAALLGELQAGDARVLEGVADEDDLGAEAARVLDLHARGEARHDDRRRDAHALRVVGDGLRVVAGRDREHALGALGGSELRHLVERAALLERGGELQVLKLEEDGAAADLRQCS
jgi:hypothetical protein